MNALPVLLMLLAAWIAGCGENASSRDDVAPVPPRIVTRSADNVYAQTGIRAQPASRDDQYRVRIEWYPNAESDVAGYRIWRRREDEPVSHHGILRDLRFGVNLDRAPILVFLDNGDNFNGFPADL